MLNVALLDVKAGSGDGLALVLIVAIFMLPRLLFTGVLISAIPGVLIGAITARVAPDSSLRYNIIIGTLVGFVIEVLLFQTEWWPYATSNGYAVDNGYDSGLFWIALIFRSMLPIWLIAIKTSKIVNPKIG